MTWENPRTPEEKDRWRINTARRRLEGILTLMDYKDSSGHEQNFAIFTGRTDSHTTNKKRLWGIFNRTELADYFKNDDVLLTAAGVYGALEMTLIPVNNAIEAYL